MWTPISYISFFSEEQHIDGFTKIVRIILLLAGCRCALSSSSMAEFYIAESPSSSPLSSPGEVSQASLLSPPHFNDGKHRRSKPTSQPIFISGDPQTLMSADSCARHLTERSSDDPSENLATPRMGRRESFMVEGGSSTESLLHETVLKRLEPVLGSPVRKCVSEPQMRAQGEHGGSRDLKAKEDEGARHKRAAQPLSPAQKSRLKGDQQSDSVASGAKGAPVSPVQPSPPGAAAVSDSDAATGKSGKTRGIQAAVRGGRLEKSLNKLKQVRPMVRGSC